jgi:DNA repair protein RadA/Sms
MGFSRCLLPKSNLKRLPDIDGIDIEGVETVSDVADKLF